jgi:hypothetical protein
MGKKISNQGSPQNSIVVIGYMDIDGVKITSWDPEENSVVYQDSLGSVPRPYNIRYQDADGGGDPELGARRYGIRRGKRMGFSLGGTAANILITNNDFHHWWYAFYYSAGSRNVTIDNNEYHDNYMYAIDPHSGTSDMNITKTTVFITTDTTELFVLRTDCSNLLI